MITHSLATDVVLLPLEWSQAVAEAGMWGWWGYNKDRIAKVNQPPDAAEAVVKGDAKASKKRRKSGTCKCFSIFKMQYWQNPIFKMQYWQNLVCVCMHISIYPVYVGASF